MGFNPLKVFKPKNFNPANKIKGELNKLKGTIKKEVIQEIKDELIKPVEKEISSVKREVEKIPATVEKEIKNALQSAVDAVKKLIQKEGEKILEIAVPDESDFKLGKIVLSDIKHDYQKSKRIVSMLTRISNKNDVVNFIAEVKPEKVGLNLEAEIPVVTVGAGWYPKYKTDKFLKVARKLI